MEIERFSLERGAIRFSIEGSWSREQLSSFLWRTNDIYRRVNSIFVLRAALDAEARTNEGYQQRSEYDRQDFSWHNQYIGAFHHHPMGIIGVEPPKYLQLVELASSVSEPLQIDAISYASPGWIQMIGDWNPLKVLADFISKWRAENTKRETNRLKAQTERQRIQADLVAKILDQAPKMPRNYDGGTSRLLDLVEEVICPTGSYIEEISTSTRVVDAQIVSPGERLPSRRPRHKQAESDLR